MAHFTPLHPFSNPFLSRRAGVAPTGPVPVSSLSHNWHCVDQSCINHPFQHVRDIYKMVMAAAKFFSERFKMQGIREDGMQIYVDWKEANAAWVCAGDKSCVMQFNNDFIEQGVVVHEYAHAIVSKFRFRPLEPKNQSGALNESFADVCAIIFKHMNGRNNWAITDNGSVSRDLSIQAHMNEYDQDLLDKDNGGVHSNSRIPSHAFYLAVQISNSPSDGVLADIWYSSMMDRRRPSNESFYSFALATIQWSQRRFTSTPTNQFTNMRIRAAVKEAWIEVGVLKNQFDIGFETSISLPQPFTLVASFPNVSLEVTFYIHDNQDGTYSIIGNAISYNIVKYPIDGSESETVEIKDNNSRDIFAHIALYNRINPDDPTKPKIIDLAPNTLSEVKYRFEQIRKGKIYQVLENKLYVDINP